MNTSSVKKTETDYKLSDSYQLNGLDEKPPTWRRVLVFTALVILLAGVARLQRAKPYPLYNSVGYGAVRSAVAGVNAGTRK